MNAIQIYGSTEEVTTLAKRFKTALRGGDKLNNNELIALAQISNITHLNPFIGELWYIPGKGPMIGIAGARRLWNEKSAAGGGWSSVVIATCTAEEAGYTGDIKDLAAAFKATAHDSSATAQYQKIFTETIKVMRESGSTDPFADAKQICGPRPQWEGYGYSTVSETSRMNKTQLARKRAEADALKKCIDVPFGLEVSAEYETAPAHSSSTLNASAIDADFTDAGEPEHNAPSAAPIITRPYSPQQLKEKIADLTVQLANYPAKGTEAQTVAMNLNDCFGGNDDKRKAVLFYLTGKASAGSIEVETLKALKKWINPTKTDSGWVMDSLSIKEAHAVYAEAMKEQGQLEFMPQTDGA